MFRRLASSLPPDPIFPADLNALGYYITDEDKIRTIKSPHQKYHYGIDRNERVNDMHKEAMNSIRYGTCISSVRELTTS